MSAPTMLTTTNMPTTPTTPTVLTDPRVTAFCKLDGPEVFSGIVHGNQIWTPDPFDVENIHADAREAFTRLLNRASSVDLPPHGTTLLLLGEAGSGKSHLMRAFRNGAHATGTGYCGYLQMTSRTDNYARYILSNLIDSLEQPYKDGHSETGLTRLARGILDLIQGIPREERSQLTDDPTLTPDETAKLVHRFAYMAVQDPRFRGIDIDVIRGVLFVLANDLRLHALALKWLRCEDLGRPDRELLGDLVPRPQLEMPLKTILDLGRLMRAVHEAALVLLVDQIEQVIDLDRHSQDRGEQFRFAINTLVDVADGLPNAVVVIGCLEDLFTEGRQHLPKPKLDRIERDPDPVRLSSKRTEAEIADMIALRMEAIFDAAEAPSNPANPIAPYTSADLRGLVPFRPRDILDNLRRHRENCFKANGWVVPNWTEAVGPINPPSVEKLSQQWNDFHKAYKTPVLDETKLAELLAFTIEHTSGEMPNGTFFRVDPDGRFLQVEVNRPGNAVDKLLAALCDKSPKGGGLARQVQEVVKKVGDDIPAVVIRSTEFPKDSNQIASKELAKLTVPRGKGRRVVVVNSDWRAMAAFRDFQNNHHQNPGFSDWQRDDRPLAQLRSIHTILALEKLLTVPASTEAPATVQLPPAGIAKEPITSASIVPPPLPEPAKAGPIRLGVTRSAIPATVELVPADLRRHIAFLGGSGSGKTTAALTVIEQLLLAGIPAVLLDRKGDLAQYADPAIWTAPEADAERAARRARLRAAIDVQLYTPGAEAGRPLSIPVVPSDLSTLSSADQGQIAEYAAASLGIILGYKGRNPDPKLVILQKAIEVLARVPGASVTVKGVRQLIFDRDDSLTSEVDGYDDKHYKKLAEDLLTLAHQRRRLLEGGNPLDVDLLLGRGAYAVPGKTRLTIINTQFLGDPTTTEFWVAQFLLSVDRWRAKNPAPDGVLQAVFLFDEADQYLPAIGKPATKGPMESLLKRGRSAGLGIFLATQSPGDFDYRCRDQITTWLVGKVKEPRALEKLKPVFEAVRSDALVKLPGQEIGQFFLVREAEIAPVRVDRNLIRTTQLSEDRILTVARQSSQGAG
jgi:hypothetical protein